MTKTIRFKAVADRSVIGDATLTDADTIEYGNSAVEAIMGPLCRRVGDAKAFAYFAGRSNGYVFTEPA